MSGIITPSGVYLPMTRFKKGEPGYEGQQAVDKWLTEEKRRARAYRKWCEDKPKMRDPEFKRKVADYVREHSLTEWLKPSGWSTPSNWVSTQEAYEAVLKQELNEHEHTGRCDDAK